MSDTLPLSERFADQLMQQRVILIAEEVDDPLAARVCSQLMLLSAQDPTADIALLIHSPGGSVPAGLAMYDTMRLVPNDVITLGMGLAASMGQVLLCAGAAGKRYALPHARILMHQGSAGLQGTAVDIAIQAENLEHTKATMLALIAEHTGQPVERIERDSDRDRWFTAEQAVEYGFVDEIVTSMAQVLPGRRRAGLGAQR
ncbi:ClpP family protease [Ruania alba]|uniref:ATP-dependent Clp protease proteolytic subunit n=1 Tax=Ruania alba TaxID=648782 RepID=A0A1H5ERD8_9MICO|nr:ATP-dependent Clp protease proteolytic subunit [Ruania alba]SED93639.1 ATP-dependent Clp protease proteolytic subunit ClpP [Ruania alba]